MEKNRRQSMEKVRITRILCTLFIGFLIGIFYEKTNNKNYPEPALLNKTTLIPENKEITNSNEAESQITMQITYLSPQGEKIVSILCENFLASNSVYVQLPNKTKTIVINNDNFQLLRYFWNQIDLDSYTKCNLHELKLTDEQRIEIVLTQYKLSKKYHFYLPIGITSVDVLKDQNLTSFNTLISDDKSDFSSIDNYIRCESAILSFLNIFKSLALQE